MHAQDQALVDHLAQQFFLSDLVATPTYLQIQQQIQARHPADADGELPDAYWDDLNAAVSRLLRQAIELNAPLPAAS